MRRPKVLLQIAGSVGLGLASAVLALAQQPQTLDGKTAEQAFKNIKVLNAAPASELNATMHLISGSLGVVCEYCHVEGSFDKDDKTPKETAREMITMVQGINNTSFKGKQVVTCYTCHHGSPKPAGVPILPLGPYFEESPTPALPSADQIVTRYVQALGGEQAIRKIRTRLVTAAQDIPTGPGGVNPIPGQTEQYQKAPNLVVTVSHYGTTTISSGFDGTRAWSLDARGRVTEPLNIDQMRIKRAADFYEPLDLKREYSSLEVTGKEKINGRDAYVVVGSVTGDLPEQLYFDAQAGMLLRKRTVLPTSVGLSPFEIDFDDYRDTGSGVKFPFLISMTPASPRTELVPRSVMRITKIQENIPIEDSKFRKPQPQPSAP